MVIIKYITIVSWQWKKFKRYVLVQIQISGWYQLECITARITHSTHNLAMSSNTNILMDFVSYLTYYTLCLEFNLLKYATRVLRLLENIKITI